MRVVLTGGTGFVGRNLCAALADRGDPPIVITRDASAAAESLGDRAEVVEADPTESGPWQESVVGCDAVVHLAGASINGKRWDARYRQVLRGSRIDSAAKLVEAIAAAPAAERPSVLVTSSGIDYYPFAEELAERADWFEDSWVGESAPRSGSFLGQLCRDWEDEAATAESLGVRVCAMRSGIVLGRGGPLAKMILPFKLFAGGRLGSGKQWTSWIHIDDAVAAYLFAIDTPEVSGPINLVAPSPVRNREFARQLGRTMGRPSFLPTPTFALKLALGPFAEHVLHGRRVEPKCLVDAGFEFKHPDLRPALEDLLD